jgi:paraquat-inducible protein A
MGLTSPIFGSMRYLLPLTLFAASISLALGVTMPLVRMERLYFFSEEPSLIEIVRGLWNQGEIGLSILVTLFSLVFPVLKLGSLHMVAFNQTEPPRWLKALTNWSMLDVLLVALVIFAAKTSGLAAAFSQAGLWMFAASAALTALAAALLRAGKA